MFYIVYNKYNGSVADRVNTMNTGYWIQHTHFLDPDEYKCSECGETFDRKYAVCPSCGAEMHGTETDVNWVDEAAYLDIILGDK